jgi:hypothetical protein
MNVGVIPTATIRYKVYRTMGSTEKRQRRRKERIEDLTERKR